MIIFENKTWQTSTSEPDTNYLEGIDCEQPKWVVPDNSELTGKIMSTPYWKPVEDGNGQLVDIIPEEPPVTDEERIAQLKSELDEIDRQAIRPLRAIAAGNDTEEDRENLAELEEQAEEIRLQIAKIEG
ncbi:MAG: hypothetical protein K2J79_02870 [Ruminiclostridium sp.]|nr:hypothetical protein [Ruminiclostridium sp.]